MKNIKQNIICFLIYGGFACCLAFVLITNLANNERPVLENKESESIAQSKDSYTDNKKIVENGTESDKSYQVENNKNISNKNETQNKIVENTTNEQQTSKNEEKIQIIKKEDSTSNNTSNTQQVKEETTTNKPINNTQINKEPVKEEVKPVQKEEPVKVQTPSTSENKTNTSTKIPSKPIVSKPIIEKPVISNTNKIVLIDKSNGASCAQAIEYFYEDSNYKYYFTCIKSQSMYVRINGKEYGLVYALKNNIVTIKDLENNGYHFSKKAKNLQVK